MSQANNLGGVLFLNLSCPIHWQETSVPPLTYLNPLPWTFADTSLVWSLASTALTLQQTLAGLLLLQPSQVLSQLRAFAHSILIVQMLSHLLSSPF